MDEYTSHQGAAMAAPDFRIWLCGTFRVERRVGASYEAVRTVEWGGSSYPRLLLKALLCRSGRQARRDALMELLWPECEPEQMVQNLNTATSKLRTVLRLTKERESLLFTENDASMYRLPGQEQLWVDADAAMDLLKQAERLDRSSAETLALLEEAEGYFRQGPFQQDEEGQWIAGRRATVEQARYQCRLWLAEAYEQQNMPGQAVTTLSLMLEEDPFDEDILCRLMALLHQQGMTHQALRYYQSSYATLSSEGLEPAQATRELAVRIKANRYIPSETPSQLVTNTIGSPNMDSLRRNLLQTLVGTGIVASYHYFYRDLLSADYSSSPSIASIHALENITVQFRAMQRRGDTFITQSLYSHIATIQNALEMTHNETLRRELWRVLAQAQLVARLLPIKKGNGAKVKTLNESAIASAQNSGDTVLVAASIGHLVHFHQR